MSSLAWTLLLVASLEAAPLSPSSQPGQAPEAWPDDKPFTRLIGNLVDDGRALASRDSGVILAGGVLGALIVEPADDDLAEWARDEGDSGLADFGRALGDGWTQGGIAVGAYVAGRVTDRRELTHIGSDLVRAQVLNAVITRVGKLVISRDRPSGGNHAMPSGHASATFTTASVLHGHYGWRVGVPAYAVASFVGWSSVRTEAHWVTDVVIGATVGTLVGHAVTRGHRARDWQVIPVRTSGGAALFVVRR